MTKRIISLFLACIIAIPIAILPASADRVAFIDLKGQGFCTVEGQIDTDFEFFVGSDDPTEIFFPVDMASEDGMIELLIEGSNSSLSVTHEPSHNAFTVTNIGTNLHLCRCEVETGLSDSVIITYTTGTHFKILRARFYPNYVSAQTAKFSLYANFSGSGTLSPSTLYSSVNVERKASEIGAEFITDQDGENPDTAGYFSDLYITLTYTPDQIRAYDKLYIDFVCQDWALEGVNGAYSNDLVDISLSGFAIDNNETVFNGFEWTYGTSRYTIEIDLNDIDYSDTANLIVTLQGHMMLPSSTNEGPFLDHKFKFTVNRSEVMLFAEVEEPEVSLLVRIWQSIENMTSSILRLFEDNEEIVDDFRDEQAKDETKVDDFIDVIETTPTVNLDDVDDLVKPLDDLEIDTNYTTVLAGTLDGDFGTYLIMFPVILAVIGYILYGKR